MRTNRDWLFTGGRWWRFSGYEIRDGYIRPQRGAKLEAYDPWATFVGTRQKGDEWIPPYAEFVNLHIELGGTAGHAEHQFLAWCVKYGLPGTLLHRSRVVTLAPRWTRTDTDDGSLLLPSQLQYVRTATGWKMKRHLLPAENVAAAFGVGDREGSLLLPDDLRDPSLVVGVAGHALESSEPTNSTLADSWARYFPGVAREEAETFAYPAPLSEPFWNSYAEPYADFLDALRILSQALWELRHLKPETQISADEFQHVRTGVDLLQGLLEPASVSIVPMRDGTFSQEWVCGSLLSALAMMALHDLTENRNIRACDACHRLFVSQHPGARYCSSPCRWRTQKKRQRDRAAKPDKGSIPTKRPGRSRS